MKILYTWVFAMVAIHNSFASQPGSPQHIRQLFPQHGETSTDLSLHHNVHLPYFDGPSTSSARRLPDRARVLPNFSFRRGYQFKEQNDAPYNIPDHEVFRVVEDADGYVVGILNRYNELVPIFISVHKARVKVDAHWKREPKPMEKKDKDLYPELQKYLVPKILPEYHLQIINP